MIPVLARIPGGKLAHTANSRRERATSRSPRALSRRQLAPTCAGRIGSTNASAASSVMICSARWYVASASSGVSPTAVSPMRPSSLRALIMWKTTPTLPGLVEMEAVAGHDVEQVVMGEAAERGRFEMVGGHHVLLSPLGAVNSAVAGS